MSRRLRRRQSTATEVLETEDPASQMMGKSSGKPTLLSYDQMPEWHQDNNYILQGYRPVSVSARACFESWLYVHNETLNIYTHLIPSIFFLGTGKLMDHHFRLHYPDATLGDRFIFALFLLAAATCLGMSATYHTLMNHSMTMSHLMLRFDFVGIMVLIIGKFVSGVYVGFYCEPYHQQIYWTMIVTLGSATIFILVNPKYQGRRWRTFRLSTFIATALSGFLPLAHGTQKFGLSKMIEQSGMPYYLLEGLILAVGTVVYGLRVPECFKPGRFDILGSSHQLFHVLVVLAAMVHFYGILDAFDYGYHHRRC